MTLLFIADSKIYRLDEGKLSEIENGILEKYREKLYQNVKRSEWKKNGSGARFLEQAAAEDAEEKLRNLYFCTDALAVTGDTLLFSQTIENTSGIYTKTGENDEGIVLSDSGTRYGEFDELDGQLAVSASFAGESHIGLIRPGVAECRLLTEGETIDRHPFWSRFEKDVIYYSSAGLEITGSAERPEEAEGPSGLPARLLAAQRRTARNLGPASLCRLDLSAGEIDEILSDNRYDYIKPSTDGSGNLYFIRKPYKAAENRNLGVGSCLLDILLFPFRLIRALLGFLNFFSVAYSGKTIRKSGTSSAKTRKNSEIYIDGNLIRADKEQKANEKKKDPYPGIIPRSFELCRRGQDGEITVLKKGVIAYRVTDEGIVVSNGSGILLLGPDGKEKKLCDAPRVTYLYEEKSV